jgi:hypothetical protein
MMAPEIKGRYDSLDVKKRSARQILGAGRPEAALKGPRLSKLPKCRWEWWLVREPRQIDLP